MRGVSHVQSDAGGVGRQSCSLQNRIFLPPCWVGVLPGGYQGVLMCPWLWGFLCFWDTQIANPSHSPAVGVWGNSLTAALVDADASLDL